MNRIVHYKQQSRDAASLDGHHIAGLELPGPGFAALVTALAREERISTVRLLAADHAQTAIQTREKGMRARDGSFDGLLLIEGLDEAAVKTAAGNLAAQALKRSAPAPIYTTISVLDRRLL